ncbi:nickel-binding protein, partial [Mycobacteroides abscessus]|uniref:nickel-binding protein n=1 Tax=Mycobacteroides abscessus TaxID=36809 RepID=UPI0010564D11
IPPARDQDQPSTAQRGTPTPIHQWIEDKCLCFYDAPDEEAVLRARKAVDTPVDRLHGLGEISL